MYAKLNPILFPIHMSQIHEGGRGSKCKPKSPYFFCPKWGEEGRGSTTLGRNP